MTMERLIETTISLHYRRGRHRTFQGLLYRISLSESENSIRGGHYEIHENLFQVAPAACAHCSAGWG